MSLFAFHSSSLARLGEADLTSPAQSKPLLSQAVCSPVCSLLLQRGLWDGRAGSPGLIPWPAGLFWQGVAAGRSGMDSATAWTMNMWAALGRAGTSTLGSGMCAGLGKSGNQREHPLQELELWLGAAGAFLAQCPAGLIPGSCCWSLCSHSALAAPKRDFLQSRALAKKSGAGSDTELAEDKPSW